MTKFALEGLHHRTRADLTRNRPAPDDDDTDWRSVAEPVGELLACGAADAALDAAEAAVQARPLDGHLHMIRGQALLAADRHPEAAAALSRAMALGTDVEILDLLAAAVLPGPGYRDHLAALHRTLRPARYLEIGVFEGKTLALAQAGTRATGIDPAPRAESARRYEAQTCIHRITSDAWFANGGPGGEPDGLPIDLAFIDGLHLYEQVLRDFINLERHCHAGSAIVLHDTLPVAAPAASRVRRTQHWCGDVWKIVPCLQAYRPDLALLTIPTHPSGLTIVTHLDPASRVLRERHDEAVARWIDADLPPGRLAATGSGDVANDPHAVCAWVQGWTACPNAGISSS